jgi:hypothetical protein
VVKLRRMKMETKKIILGPILIIIGALILAGCTFKVEIERRGEPTPTVEIMQELRERIEEFHRLLGEKLVQGYDVSQALELNRQSMEAAGAGDEKRALELLELAIEALKKAKKLPERPPFPPIQPPGR